MSAGEQKRASFLCQALFMITKKLPPHLVESRGVKRCSECNQAFSVDSALSLSAAFRKHLTEIHKPAQPEPSRR
jgi:hypothetical protein